MPLALPKPTRTIAALLTSLSLVGLSPVLAQAATNPINPIITGYSAGSSDATLTITGADFGTTAAAVAIDGTTAAIVNWSNTSITVNLPATAGPGTVSVTTSTGVAISSPFSGVERGYYSLSPSGAVTAGGAVPTFGDLTTSGTANTSPAIQLVATNDYQGYWILTQNGTVSGFGDATNFGALPSPVTAVSMAVTPSGTGVYVLGSSGQVYTMGQAVNYGSAPAGITAAAIAVTPDGNGYWILGTDGTVYPFGDAPNLGSAAVTQAPSTTPVSYPNGTLLQVARTGPIFVVGGTTVYHIPSIAVLKGLGDTIGKVKHVANLDGYTLGNPMIVPYVDGTVLEPQDSSTIYLVQNGMLHPFSTAAVFQSSNIPAAMVHAVPTIPANWPIGSAVSTPQPYVPNGTLYRPANSKNVYILDNGQLDQIASGQVFDGMGLKWPRVQNVPALPSAYPVGAELTTAAPLVTNGSLWRVKGAIYVDEGGTLRHIPSAALFNALGFQWKEVTNLPSLGSLPVGTAMGSTTIPAGQQQTLTAVSLVPTADGQGYWILLQNGQVETLGDAPALGQLTAGQLGPNRAVQLSLTPDQEGYTILASNGSAYSVGDALSAQPAAGAVSLAMTAQPSALVSSSPSGFFSMAYGSFMPNYDGSYTTMVDNPNGLSAIIPTWYYEQQNPTTLGWNPGTPPQTYSSVVTQAHSEGVQVWPMVGSTSVGPFQTSAAITKTVSLLVAAAVQNNYDGLTIDFEPSQFNGLSMAQTAQQYVNFVAQLGPALHAAGKKLMVDTYSAFFPATPYNLPAIAPYVDYINIMSYGHYDYTTQAGPDAGLGWMQSVYQTAIGDGVNPAQIIMGFGPYGDYWSFNNSGLDKGAPLGNDVYVSDSQVQQLLLSNPGIVPIFDPTYGSEIFMTNEYVNASGQWTVNPNGQAVAPTQTLSINDQNTVMPQVENLQGLLNYILVRYAVQNNQPVPSYLNLSQDGKYGTFTQRAVTQFQQDFSVAGAAPGVYDSATQAALQSVIQQWNLGEYQYWVDNTQSMQNRVQQVAVADNLGGMAVWRLPFETSDFWQTLESTATVAHSSQGGN